MRKISIAVATTTLFLVWATLCLGQEITGSIVGTIKDSAGAGVAGATVTVVIPSQDNRLIRKVTTTDEGTFSVPNIPVNSYSVTIEAPNFKKSVQTDVKVEVGQRRSVDVVLEAGNISETVTVQADQVALEASTPASSTSIKGDIARELSVNNRNWIQFVTLAPGVSNNLADLVPVGSFSPDGSPAIAAIAVNGARQSQNTFTVDGADITDRGSNVTLQAFPSVDSIGELKVLRSLYPAESGRSGGGQVNIVTRSGTDQFHGAFYEFFRNERLNASSFLNNRTAPLGREGDDCTPTTQTSAACIQNGKAKRPPFRYNNYGFTIGGPIYFLNFGEGDDKGLFRRYRKTFFFFSEEQRKDRRYSNLTGSVPTEGLRNGVFTFPICLNATMPTTTTRTCNQVLPAGTPLSSALINPGSAQYLNFIFRNEPLPTTGFVTTAPAVSTFDFQQEILKVDTSFTDDWTAYYRYERDKIPSLAPNSVFSTPCNVAGVCPAVTDSPGRTHTFQTAYVFSPNLIAEMRYTHAYGAINVATGGLSSLVNSPVSVALPYAVSDDRVPSLALTNLSTIQAFGPYANFSNKDDFGGNVTWVSGNHTMKFGVNYSKYRKNEDNGLGGTGQGSFTAFFNTNAASTVRGTVCVDPTNTANAIACPAGNQTTEQNFANFLLGNNVTFTQTKYRLTADFRQQNFEGYAQDEYRIRPTVTLYAGVRYSFFGAPYAANGLLSNFVPELYNKAQAPAVDFAGNRSGGNWCNGIILNTQNYTTGPASYNCTPLQSPYGKFIYKAPTRNFAPRLGIAWDLNGKGTTVIRTGYGIYHEQTLVGNIETHLGANPPYQETCTVSGGSVSNPVPGGTCTPNAPAAGIPGIIRGVDLDYKTPYMQHWSFDVQRLFGSKNKVQVGYYGSKGTHLIGVADINLLPSGYALTQTCQRTATTTGLCQSKDASGNAIPITTTAESLILDQIRPYKGWRGIAMVQPRYNSNYHSLQVSATRQFTNVSQASLAYTWSKNLTDNQSDRSNAPQNYYDIASEYGRASLDRRHILTVNYVYEIPVYTQQRGFTGKLLGGWQASGIITAQSGLPFTPTYSSYDPAGNGFINASSPAGGRPNVVAGQDPNDGPRTFDRWFNTAAFQTANPNPLIALPIAGTAGRGVITGPPTYRVDFTMTKNLRFTETKILQFKGEVFNAFNHTNFTTLGLSASTPATFGTVTGTRDPRTLQLGIKFLF